jgi:two-component system, chemotaxis family, chemotaxis protein CheY
MTPNPKRALVAEDNAALARVIAVTLRREGFEVVAACNGEEAWRQAQQQGFDLVVTDQQMPLMTGLELCERLRASATHRDTPVVLLTAKGLELEREEVRDRYGVAELLLKPFSPAALASLATEVAASAV